MHRTLVFLLIGALAASAAYAHVGVKNAAVMTRMHNMKDSAAALETLGKMDKGESPFDASRASDAKNTLISLLSNVAAVFEAPETDPLTEARPEIWDNWQDFVRKSDAATEALNALDVTSREALRPGLMKVAQACSACHETYRLEK